MAKETATTDISPTVFLPGGQIGEEHWQDLIKQQNWVRSYRPRVYLSLNCAVDGTQVTGWDSGNQLELGTLGLDFDASVSYVKRIDVPIVTADHVTNLKVGVRLIGAVTFLGTVRFQYFIPPGTTANADVSVSYTDNGNEVTGNLDISGIKSSGSDTEGRLLVYIIQNSSPAVDCSVRNLRVLDDISSIGTPDPSL